MADLAVGSRCDCELFANNNSVTYLPDSLTAALWYDVTSYIGNMVTTTQSSISAKFTSTVGGGFAARNFYLRIKKVFV